jgi:predicted CoA-substrate-specific enzyme activase
MICAGIDAGSRTIKVVLLDTEGLNVRGSGVTDQGVEQDRLAEALLDRVLGERGLGRRDVGRIVGTGYARNIVGAADTTVTEITCHACGVHRLAPDARSVIDIGGQDSKVLHLEADGGVRDFTMNDRCAAGTGRFLEMAASRLGVALSALGEMAARSRCAAPISSTCAVFAETEMVGLLASGVSPEDIAAGVQASIASRVVAMAAGRLRRPVVLTGGVALVPGMAEALASALGVDVTVAPNPQMTGALGAALLAARQAGSGNGGE